MSDSPSPATSRLEELLKRESEEREIAGNQPLLLDDTGKAWLIVKGRVEIFAAKTSNATGAMQGARNHLTTAGAGEMLFAIGRPPSPFGRQAPDELPAVLLAVAHPGTLLYETRAAVLTRLAREPRHLPLLGVAIEGWVSGLCRRIPRPSTARRFTELRSGSEVHLREEGLVARTVDGVVWVRQLAGRSHFLGRDELALEPADLPLPISDGIWLTSAGEALLSCVATGHLLRSGVLWEGMSHFHALFLRYVALTLEAAEEEQQRQLEQRLERDDQTLRSAYSSLASVMRPTAGEGLRPVPTRAAADPLFATCRLVGDHLGLALSPPPSSEKVAGEAGTLRRISDASRVRHRRVLLRDDWWRRDNGPLLAFVEDGADPSCEPHEKPRRPVALLPTSPTRYELVDPAAQARTPVDAAVAKTLAGDAYMFYPALPERPLHPWDLLRLALRDRWRDLLTILLTGLGGGLLSVLVPIVTEQLYGRVIPDADRSQLLQMTLVLGVAACGAGAFQITRSVAVLRLTGKVAGSLQAAVWDRLLALPTTFFRRFTVGDLSNRAMGIEAMSELLLGHVTTSILSLVFSIFSFALLFYYSFRLALLASSLIAFLILITSTLSYLQLRHQRELLRIDGRISSLVFGLIRGIAKLRTSGGEKRAYARWAEHFSALRHRAFRAQRLANVQTAMNAAYGVVSSLALFAMMGLALEDGLAVSRFLAFSAAFGQVQAAALTFASLISGLLAVVPIYERLQPILQEVPEVDASKIEAGELSGDIELRSVVFRYHEDTPLVLEDVSLRARPGELIALVGRSGAGKSTALRLLLGFEKPISGSIYYDGKALASLDLQSVRRQIGVVLQNSRPMSGDIRSNILGSSNLSIEAAWEAARMAGLEDDIKAMPMGMHTVIGEGAETFSGGQIQRLMIARAIVNRPRIIFFDEATSALDNPTQDIVSRSLERLQATRIIVAHRLSTICNADRIYVIDGGRVVEDGSYGELAGRGSLFAELVERQVA